MRIVHVTQTLGRGGLEILLERIALGQRQRGHQVRVVCLTAEGQTADRLRSAGIEVSLAGVAHALPGSLLKLRRQLLRKFPDGGLPDVIHLHAMPAGTLGRPALLATATRRIVHFHTSLSSAHHLNRFQKIRELALVPAAHVILAISEAVKQDLVEQIGLPRNRINVLSGGVPDLRPEQQQTKPEARRKWGLKAEDRVIVCVANLLPHKGHPTLLEAVAMLPEVVLLLAGEGPERAAIEDRIKQPDLAGRVRLLGAVADIAGLLAAADVAVQPSFPREGLGLAVIEAFRASIPAVVTRVGGLPEVVQEEVNGCVVEPNNPEALFRALKRLLDDSALREQLGQNARKRFLEKYELSGYLNSLDRYYSGRVSNAPIL